MTVEQARAFELRWGATTYIERGWGCCRRCGDAYPLDHPRHWSSTHRIYCGACRADEKRGIWPYRQDWHRKNRWTRDGHIERRCCACRLWLPLTAYYLIRGGVDPMCRRCRVRRAARRVRGGR